MCSQILSPLRDMNGFSPILSQLSLLETSKTLDFSDSKADIKRHFHQIT